MNAPRLHDARLLFATLALAGCQAAPAYKPPPADRYAIRTISVTTDAVAESEQAASVTPDFFELAEARPLLGRFFVDGDKASPTSIVVLSYAFWNRRLGASPRVIGQTITLDGHPAVIVGIAPRGFVLPADTQLWTLAPSF